MPSLQHGEAVRSGSGGYEVKLSSQWTPQRLPETMHVDSNGVPNHTLAITWCTHTPMYTCYINAYVSITRMHVH